MNAFLKDNIAIVAAILLPLALAMLFALSTLATRVTVADPQYDFLVATDYTDGNTKFKIETIDEKVVVTYQPSVKDQYGSFTNTGQPRLWRVNAPEMTVEEIALQEPANKRAGRIAVSALQDLKVKNITPGPDGYEFTSYHSYDNNFMAEIFGSGRRNKPRVSLVKDGRAVSIRVPEKIDWDYNTQFIGWVIDKE